MLEDWLGLNTTSVGDQGGDLEQVGDCGGAGPGDEFFHDRDEYGISELSGCKRILYSVVGSSKERVWDIFFLPPSFLTLVFLAYSYPRTRQQLQAGPLLHSALHLLLLLATAASLLRAVLMLALPVQHHSEGARDKVL